MTDIKPNMVHNEEKDLTIPTKKTSDSTIKQNMVRNEGKDLTILENAAINTDTENPTDEKTTKSEKVDINDENENKSDDDEDEDENDGPDYESTDESDGEEKKDEQQHEIYVSYIVMSNSTDS